jgi:mannose-6-phosphate isomerase-like protein (cupin superfamily)
LCADRSSVGQDGHVVTIQHRDRDVVLGPGEVFVMPRGGEHCPRSDDGAGILLIEPRGTLNAGDSKPGELTAPEHPL